MADVCVFPSISYLFHYGYVGLVIEMYLKGN